MTGEEHDVAVVTSNNKKRRKKHTTTVSLLSASVVDNDDDEKKSSRKRGTKKKRLDERTRERIAKEDAEEERLTSLIFGGGSVVDKKRNEKATTTDAVVAEDDEDDADSTNNDQEEPLFVIDTVPHDEAAATADSEHLQPQKKNSKQRRDDEQEDDTDLPVAAWNDEDDLDDEKNDRTISLTSNVRNRRLRTSLKEESVGVSEYHKRQRARFTSNQTALVDWATNSTAAVNKTNYDLDDDDEITADALLNSATPLLDSDDSTRHPLPPSKLGIVRRRDVNWSESNSSNAVLRSVMFHPDHTNDSELVLTAGLDKTLRFYKIDADNDDASTKVHGVFLPDLPLYRAAFLKNSSRVVCAGRRNFFHLYDAASDKTERITLRVRDKSLESFVASPCGRQRVCFLGNDGHLYVWNGRSQALEATLKINGSVRCAAFSKDGNELVASGSDGDVYRFDIGTRRCISRFQNEDGTISSSLSLSSDFLAVGAESGVVNLYDTNHNIMTNTNTARKPHKTVLNLRTSASSLAFHPTGEILAMASRYEKDSLKLLHVNSGGVFANWPTAKTPLGYVFDLDFSPNGGKYLAMGNDKGKCMLYRLNHYN